MSHSEAKSGTPIAINIGSVPAYLLSEFKHHFHSYAKDLEKTA
jgi:hypothetical protein